MIVLFAKAGQLGNRLFNFANFVAFSADTGNPVANPSFEEYAELFETISQDLFCRYPPKPSWARLPKNGNVRQLYYRVTRFVVRVVRKLRFNRWLTPIVVVNNTDMYLLDDNPDARKVFRADRVTFVDGLQFRDISGIRAHADAIRAFFTPIRCHRDRIDACIVSARHGCDVLVGVHIRGGDYSAHMDGRYFYSLAAYERIMREIVSLFSGRRVAFLICSNTSLDPTAFAEFHHHLGPQHFLEDMYSLARCDYLVGPPSTYSLWACFYGQVPLYFIQDPNESVSLDKFGDYFSHVGCHKVYTELDGSQYLLINGSKYKLVFKTEHAYVAV